MSHSDSPPPFSASSTPPDEPLEPPWEREVLTKLAYAALDEQRKARRWNLVFKFAILAYLIGLLIAYLPINWDFFDEPSRHTALVDVNGTISPTADARADRIATGLRAAFEDEQTAAVIVRINSPGGSPVQAGYVNDEIHRLRKKHPDIPVYAVIQDLCASGGYYIAAAADKIYADKGSVVGSIGVLLSAFGVVDAMQHLGIERRLFTAGENKAILDPFSPLNAEHAQHMQGLLDAIHTQFIDVVRKGRGDRLAKDPRLFSGLFWTGEQSVELGLVDALGSASHVAREIVGEEKIVDFTYQPSLPERIARGIGTSVASALATKLGLDRTLSLN